MKATTLVLLSIVTPLLLMGSAQAKAAVEIVGGTNPDCNGLVSFNCVCPQENNASLTCRDGDDCTVYFLAVFWPECAVGHVLVAEYVASSW